MKKKTFLYKIILILTAAALFLTGAADGLVGDVRVVSDVPAASLGISYETDGAVRADGTAIFTDTEADVFLFGSIPLKTVDLRVYDGQKVAVGGFPFGVKLYTGGVLIVGTSEIRCGSKTYAPADDAGLLKHDVIVAVNGSEISTVEEITALIESSGGKPIRVTVRRGEETRETVLTPVLSDESGKYQAGLWIRDNTSGLGTVTFYIPDSGIFAGLGHGITDTDSGDLIPLVRGIVTNVKISGIRRGEVGSPGELQGYFSSGRTGTLVANTECGVFGVFAERPDGAEEALYPFALRDEIQPGGAELICTVDGDGPRAYRVEISGIARDSGGNKNFVVTVTDPALIEKTGGIVQGMSGSPIVQNGKIVGAVTHVLINNPTRGYGILIENMLENLPDILRG